MHHFAKHARKRMPNCMGENIRTVEAMNAGAVGGFRKGPPTQCAPRPPRRPTRGGTQRPRTLMDSSRIRMCAHYTHVMPACNESENTLGQYLRGVLDLGLMDEMESAKGM